MSLLYEIDLWCKVVQKKNYEKCAKYGRQGEESKEKLPIGLDFFNLFCDVGKLLDSFEEHALQWLYSVMATSKYIDIYKHEIPIYNYLLHKYKNVVTISPEK